MARGIFHVESRPSSPAREDEYNAWYDGVHLAEVVALDGFVGARRLAPVDDDGPYLALYEIEGEDLEAIVAGLKAAAAGGRLQMSDAMQMDPPPSVRLLRVLTEHGPGGTG